MEVWGETMLVDANQVSDGSGKRPRGRPPKHKTRSLVEAFKKPAQRASSSTTGVGDTPEDSVDAASGKNTYTDAVNNVNKPSELEKTTTTRKRTHAEFKETDDNSLASTSKLVNKNVTLPQRRSSRQTTVIATQVSEGTLRPPGPPHLEAALNIALRNLESATWGFLWGYHEKHQGKPLPNPSEIKALSKSVKRASDLADKADRELEEAVDEIMLSNAKRKRRGPILSKYVVDRLFDTDSSASSTPVIRRTPCQD